MLSKKELQEQIDDKVRTITNLRGQVERITKLNDKKDDDEDTCRILMKIQPPHLFYAYLYLQNEHKPVDFSKKEMFFPIINSGVELYIGGANIDYRHMESIVRHSMAQNGWKRIHIYKPMPNNKEYNAKSIGFYKDMVHSLIHELENPTGWEIEDGKLTVVQAIKALCKEKGISMCSGMTDSFEDGQKRFKEAGAHPKDD